MPSASPSYETLSHSVCQDYAVHARSIITFKGIQSTIRNGDVGISPGISITSDVYPNYVDGGPIYAASASFAAFTLANHGAFLAVQADGVDIPSEIGGLTFTPGTYRSGSTFLIAENTVVTLDGENEPNPTFLFQAVTALTVSDNVYFILINGATFENVSWVLGTAATLRANSTIPGSILAGSAITLESNAVLNGCALAQTAVNFVSGGSVISGRRVPS
jgi:hypothetical protein